MLETKRQMTNKENNPPPMIATATLLPSTDEMPSSSSLAPEKPIRKDLRRIHDESSFLDNSASYICDNSGDPEYSMINRLMADFNLNRDSIIGQKRTPLKSLKVPDASAKVASPIKMTSPYKSSASERNLPISLAEDAVRSDAQADDTLEEMEYVLDRGLNYVPKRLREQLEQQSQQESSASDKTTSTVRRVELSPGGNSCTEDAEANDENNENHRSGLNNENNEMNVTFGNDRSIGSGDDDDVILIESSPENSFATTNGHYRTAVGSIENTFYTAKSDLNRGSTSSNQSSTLINRSAHDNDRSDVIVLDDSGINRSASLDGSELLNEQNVTSSRYSAMPEFNDSLERVEYYMAQAEKMMNKATGTPKPSTPLPKSVAKALTPQQTRALKTATPKSVTPTVQRLKAQSSNPKLLTPEIASGKKLQPTSAKKVAPRALTPAKIDAFKRPIRSPIVQAKSASKVIEARAQTRIPSKIKAPSSLQKHQFRHIASPIAAYINHTPQVPLMKTVKSSVRSLQQNKAFAVPSNGHDLDESVQTKETFSAKTPLPCKMYKSATQRQVTPEKHLPINNPESILNDF